MTQLHIDLADRSPLDAVWTFGGNVGRAGLLLRPDVKRHLQACRDELGLRYVRFGGLLDPGTGVVRPDGAFDFDRVDATIDAVLENGLMPFVTLSGASAAADGKPWHELVHALASHLDERYGCDVREWYFEVADGADDAASANDATDAPFRRYDLAAKAVKQANPEFRVGGPATGDAARLDAFLAHVAKPSADFDLEGARCDFVTVRPPDVTAVVAEISDAGADALPRPDRPAASPRNDWLTTARQKVTAALSADVALIGATWADPYGPLATEHDDRNGAAAVARAAAELSGACQGALYGGLSDIDDAPDGFRYEPFHGGPGLVTVNDIRKASFNAFRLLRDHAGYHAERLGVRWTEPVEGLGCLATREEYTLRLLLWYCREPGAPAGGPVRFTIEGLPESVREAHLEVIRPGTGSAYEAWVELGRPPFVNRTVLELLEAASHPAMAEVDFREYPPRLEPGMVMQLSIQMPFEDMA